MHEATFTPPEVAAHLRVKASKIIQWIRSGELSAFDVSNRPGIGRPRYRITEEAVELFQARRSPSPTATSRKKQGTCNSREYV